jgi:hypothetical protein
MILTIGSVVVITLMGAVLQVSFSQTVKRLRSKEVAHIREWQARLYASVITSGEPSSGTKSIVEDIEAGDRLVEIIHKRRNYAWAKYAFNLLFAIAPPLIRSVMIPR